MDNSVDGDVDGDGIPNGQDADVDGDGVVNIIDFNGEIFEEGILSMNTNGLSLRGSIVEENFDSIQVVLNGAVISPPLSYNTMDGTFSANLTLVGQQGQEFMNNITIYFNDTFGQRGNISLRVLVDKLGPQITAFSPATNATSVAQPAIGIVTHEPAVSCDITYPMLVTTGTRTDLFSSQNRLDFSATLSTPIQHTAGGTAAKQITIRCADRFQNINTASRMLRIDFENPAITEFSIDYFATILFESSNETKRFLITSIPPGAALKLTAATSEPAKCRFTDGPNIIEFEGNAAAGGAGGSAGAGGNGGTGISSGAGGAGGTSIGPGNYAAAHQTGLISVIDHSNKTFELQCEDLSGRLSSPKTINVLANSQLQAGAPVIILEHPFVQSNLLSANPPVVPTRTPEFNGTIISLIPGVTITGKTLLINGTLYTLAINSDNKFRQIINPLPADGSYKFTITASNSQGAVSTLNGTITADTQGPGGCVTVGGQQSCSQLGISQIQSKMQLNAQLPGSGTASNALTSPRCGDSLCNAEEFCLNDCILSTLSGFVASSQGIEEKVRAYTGIYSRNQTNVLVMVIASPNTTLITDTFNEVVSESGFDERSVISNNAVLKEEGNFLWKSNIQQGSSVVIVSPLLSENPVPNDIVTAYLTKYPSALT
ncbi:hypothetical protein HYU14_04240 [Candidatus Woesearchaeota archaeon]|nr:hypothetical protein [Candidatus Woesearchaeota archaeon]